MDEAACRALAGDDFDESAFDAQKDDEGFVPRDAVLALIGGDTAKVPEPEPVPKTAEEESDDEFELEMESLARKTVKIIVHLYSRNSERGRLGGERPGATKSASAAATLLPPSTQKTGTNHRLNPVPITFEVLILALSVFVHLFYYLGICFCDRLDSIFYCD